MLKTTNTRNTAKAQQKVCDTLEHKKQVVLGNINSSHVLAKNKKFIKLRKSTL